MEQPTIKFDELVEARQQEMESMRPGLMTKVELGKYSKNITSPSAFQKSTYKMNNK